MDALLEREDGFLSSENPDSDAALEDKKKRHRRKFAELERVYACPYRDCGRPYASEHSLQQHIRIKHSSPANSPYSRRRRACSMPMRGLPQIGVSGALSPHMGMGMYGQQPVGMGGMQGQMNTMDAQLQQYHQMHQSPNMGMDLQAQNSLSAGMSSPLMGRARSNTTPLPMSPYMSPQLGMMPEIPQSPTPGAYSHSPLMSMGSQKQMDYLDHQLNSMRLQSPGQAYAQPMSLNVPLTLTRNKSAPQLTELDSLLGLTTTDNTQIRYDLHTNSLHVPSVGDLSAGPHSLNMLLSAISANQEGQSIQELSEIELDGALLGSAALDFPGDGGVSNHMHHGAHDVYQHQQYQQQHNAHAMLPELPVGAHQQQNMQSLGVPGKALQSDSLAAFMDELKSSIMDP